MTPFPAHALSPRLLTPDRHEAVGASQRETVRGSFEEDRAAAGHSVTEYTSAWPR
jgi:hypothetical protein